MSSLCTGNFKKILLALLLGLTVGATAQAQRGIDVDLDLGTMKIQPYLELLFGYDSNVFLTETDEKDDLFGSFRIGLKQRKKLGIFMVEGDIYYYVERYQDERDADDDDIGFDVSLSSGEGKVLGNRRKIALYLDASYDDSITGDYQTGELEDSRTIGLGIGAGKTIGGGDIDLTYDFSTKSFGDKSRTFNKSVERVDIFDHNSHTFAAKLSPRISEKTHGVLIASYGLQTTDNFAEDGTYYSVRAGVDHRRSAKTAFSGTVGYIDHDEGDIGTVNFDLGGSWQATDKLSFGINGGNDISPSQVSRDNYVLNTTVGVNGRWLVTDRVAANADITWRNSEHERPVVFRRGEVTETLLPPQKFDSDTITTALRLVYAPPNDAYNLFAEGEYETRDSTIDDNSYDQFIVTTGLILFY